MTNPNSLISHITNRNTGWRLMLAHSLLLFAAYIQILFFISQYEYIFPNSFLINVVKISIPCSRSLIRSLKIDFTSIHIFIKYKYTESLKCTYTLILSVYTINKTWVDKVHIFISCANSLTLC